VSGDNTVLKKAQLLQMFYRGTTVVAPALFYLVRGLGQMNLQRAFCLRRLLHNPAQVIGRAGIRGMGTVSDADAPVSRAVPFFLKGGRLLQRLPPAVTEADQAAREYGTDLAIGRRLRSPIHKEIHIGKGGRAAF